MAVMFTMLSVQSVNKEIIQLYSEMYYLDKKINNFMLHYTKYSPYLFV